MTPSLRSAAIAIADAVSESDLVLADHPALRSAVIALREAPSVERADALAVEVGRLDASVGGGVDIVRALRGWTVARATGRPSEGPATDLPSLLAVFRLEHERAMRAADECDARAANESLPEWQRNENASMAGFHRGRASGYECAAIQVRHAMGRKPWERSCPTDLRPNVSTPNLAEALILCGTALRGDPATVLGPEWSRREVLAEARVLLESLEAREQAQQEGS